MNKDTNLSSAEEGHYVVTAHRAGVVLISKKCSFLGPDTKDVAIVKSNRLEIRQLTNNDAAPAAATSTENLTSTVIDAPKQESLNLVLDLPIRGRISTLIAFRHRSIPTDLLFFTTENHKYAVISHSPTSPTHTVTHACGSLYDGILRENECGPIAVIDPKNKCIALHLYNDWIQILPIQEGYIYNSDSLSPSTPIKKKSRFGTPSILGKPFNARINERTILDMCFLQPPTIEEKDLYNDNDLDRKLPARGSTKAKRKFGYLPQLLILHQDSKTNQHLVSHFVDLKKSELILYPNPNSSIPVKNSAASAFFSQDFVRKSKIDGASGEIIPVGNNGTKWGGVIVLGQRKITFHSNALNCTKAIPVEHTIFLSYCCISEGRYLLGDTRGLLYLLVLEMTPEGNIIAFQIEGLGIVAAPNSLVYLGNETVFVGSQFSDSQLITSLLPELTIAEEYINLGPIVDFDLVPTGTQGPKDNSPTRQESQTQSLIVTCSGHGKDGSIRLVRNGIGVEEQASVDLPGIKGMWSLRARFQDEFDTYLVQSYLGETRILGFGGSDDGEEEGELEEVVFPGFDADSSTLYCVNVKAGVVQVTERGVRLLDTNAYNLLQTWETQDSFITVAGGNSLGQIVVALRGGVLVSLKIDENGIIEMGRKQMDQEVSCIDLTPISMQHKDPNAMDTDNEPDFSSVVAVGLWNDVTVRLLALQSSALEEILKIDLGGDTQARSLILARLSNDPLLLIGLGDGNLITYSISIAGDSAKPIISTHSRKKVLLGTQSISLTAFQNRTTSKLSNTCIFATGDRPTVIYTSGTANSTSSKYSGDKLCFSNVNLSSSDSMIVNYVTPFQLPRSSQSECCLCLADESSLCIGIIDDIQKLHVQTMRLEGGAPYRIAHHEHGKCFAVCCKPGSESMTNFVRFLDNSTLEEFYR